jgi:phosphate starvation-inducible PhoH-like protein
MAKAAKRKQKSAPCQSVERTYFLNPPQLEAKNNTQQQYIENIRDFPVVIATGYPGTGKTYVAARIAAQMYRSGLIEQIFIARPAVSTSKSVGAFPGTKNEKMCEWIAPVMGALQEEFSYSYLKALMNPETGTINVCPLELIKGRSLDNTFVIVDEAEDLTVKEVKSVVTRIGKNSVIVLSGDVGQKDIAVSGLAQFATMCATDQKLSKIVAHTAFTSPDTIVRSAACRELILGFERASL